MSADDGQVNHKGRALSLQLLVSRLILFERISFYQIKSFKFWVCYLQSEFFTPFGIECGAFDRRGPDKLGRQSGVQTVALLSSVYRAAVA